MKMVIDLNMLTDIIQAWMDGSLPALNARVTNVEARQYNGDITIEFIRKKTTSPPVEMLRAGAGIPKDEAPAQEVEL